MKLTKEELKAVLDEVESVNGKGWEWVDIPAFIRRDNEDELKAIIAGLEK